MYSSGSLSVLSTRFSSDCHLRSGVSEWLLSGLSVLSDRLSMPPLPPPPPFSVGEESELVGACEKDGESDWQHNRDTVYSQKFLQGIYQCRLQFFPTAQKISSAIIKFLCVHVYVHIFMLSQALGRRERFHYYGTFRVHATSHA